MKEILNKIEQYDKIIILRHGNPDLDALGAQLGLAGSIKKTYPNKKVYVVGDENKFAFMGKMDSVEDKDFEDALVVICDVAVSTMMSEFRYLLAREIVVIDHHKNPVNLDMPGAKCENPIYTYIKSEYGSCSEIIVDLIKEGSLYIDPTIATRLYAGVAADTGRFQFGDNLSHSLQSASYLIDNGANAKFTSENSLEDWESRRRKIHFQNKISVNDSGVAFMFNETSDLEKFNMSTFDASRGMIGLMAGIEGVEIWCTFTYDQKTSKVACEFRSRNIEVLDIATKYGGGGHKNACGATIESFSQAIKIIKELSNKVEEYRKFSNEDENDQ